MDSSTGMGEAVQTWKMTNKKRTLPPRWMNRPPSIRPKREAVQFSGAVPTAAGGLAPESTHASHISAASGVSISAFAGIVNSAARAGEPRSHQRSY